MTTRTRTTAHYDENGNGIAARGGGLGYGRKYGGGKWGKYLRAPNLYFQIMERYGNRFVPLGEITTIRFGVKSGCDAFFMPRDVSAEFLEKYSKPGMERRAAAHAIANARKSNPAR